MPTAFPPCVAFQYFGPIFTIDLFTLARRSRLRWAYRRRCGRRRYFFVAVLSCLVSYGEFSTMGLESAFWHWKKGRV